MSSLQDKLKQHKDNGLPHVKGFKKGGRRNVYGLCGFLYIPPSPHHLIILSL